MSDPFVNHPVFQALDQGTMKALDRVGAGIDNIIMSIGEKLDHCTAAVRGMGKGAVCDVGSNSLTAGLDKAPSLTPSNSPSLQSQGQSPKIEKSMVPERVQAQVREAGSSSGMKCEHVSMEHCGQFAPAVTPTIGAGRSQSMSI